jgi:hypothetical protein
VADDPGERELLARDVHSSALLMALLFFIWGGLSLLTVPVNPFVVPNAAQVIVGGIMVVYLLWARRRPSLGISIGLAAAMVAYSLVLLPWTALAWCRLGRPWEAFTVPQIGTVLMAMVVPGSFWIGTLLVGLFAAESLFVFLCGKAVGLIALLPVTEPTVSLGFALVAVAILFARDQRRKLERRHVKLEAEADALRRLGPLFLRVRDRLHRELGAISAELGDAACASVPGARLSRTVGRLASIGDHLERLGTGEPSAPADLAHRTEAEQRLEAGATRTGAVLLAGATAFAVLVTLLFGQRAGWSFRLLATCGLVALLSLAYLRATRHRPSEGGCVAIMLALWAVDLVTVSRNQWLLLEGDMPFTPFVGNKMLMLVIALALSTRLWLSLGLIAVTLADALLLYLGLHLGDRRDLVSLVEPWITIVYGLIAISISVSGEQRRLTSLSVLRAEADRTSQYRRAGMFLALRDQLNSPLQTLVLCVGQLEGKDGLSAPAIERLQSAVNRLRALSSELATLEGLAPAELRRASLDAEDELRRHA